LRSKDEEKKKKKEREIEREDEMEGVGVYYIPLSLVGWEPAFREVPATALPLV
jgi:hypothetical protein